MRRHGILLLALALSGCDCSDDPGGNRSNVAPLVTILAPPDGVTVRTGTDVFLVGEATDPEDGTVANLQWSSSVDGGLGTSANVTVQLSQGRHDITLVATDSGGAVGSDMIVVNVTGANQAPTAFIDAPANGHSMLEGDDVTVLGRGVDPEEGPLAGSGLFWTSSLDGALGSGDFLTFTPSLGNHIIVLTAIDSEGAQGQASITIEVVPIGANQRPVAVIHEPSPGESFEEGAVVSFDGSALDPEDGTLTGASLVWTSSVAGVLDSGETFTRDDLAQGVHVITLTATDSLGAFGTANVTISINPVGTTPPTATIAAPGGGTAFVSGTAISFEGTGTDAEDGTLSGSALTWSSSLDGALGDGSPRVVDTLTVGAHTITLTATDSDDATGTDEIDIAILAPNTAPQVNILTPADGLTVTAGTVIDFTGEAIDTEDGPLTGGSLVWSSNLDGNMGSGTALDYGSLSVGQHTVTLSAVDSGGASGSDAISVHVDPAPQNLPPVARLNAPNNATVGATVTFDGSASSDSDGTIVSYVFDFGDGTPVQSGGADTAQHAYASEGTFLVTLTVTDDDLAGHFTTHTIHIGEVVRVPEVISDVPDALGSVCDLEMDGNDRGHIIFRDDTHPSLWYATTDGMSWQTELVDGMGWDLGGSVTSDMALTLDASGDPHIVYLIDVGAAKEVRYARKSGSFWTMETIASSASGYLYYFVDIEMDAGGQPVVLYTTWVSGSGNAPVIAERTGVDSWATDRGSYGYYAAGGLELDASDVMHVTLISYDDVYATTWSSAGGWGTVDFVAVVGANWQRVPLALDASGRDVLAHDLGIDHDLGGRNWSRSEVESWTVGRIDIADDASAELHVGLRHGTDIELMHSPSGLYGQFWERSYQGPMDDTQFGIDLDSAGAAHACFFRDGTLMFY